MLTTLSEITKDKKLFTSLFLAFGLTLQYVTFLLSNDNLLSLISGMAGVFSVVYCSEKKISMYAFGFIQLFTYVALCLEQNLYGEIIENAFYFITMIIGIFLWKRNYDNEKKEVITKSLNGLWWTILMIGVIGCSIVLGIILKSTNDTQPFMDAFSTVPAFAAQILMMLRYKEQWIFWLIVDVFTGILWLNAENYCMVAQYVFWTANCFYGMLKWSK